MNLASTIFAALVLILMQACGSGISPEVQDEMSKLPQEVSYNFHVKPILSDRCFLCHGPDAENRQAGLRLDQDSSAFAALESGLGHAIVPGNVQKSAVAARILSQDEELVMPPPESNLDLTNQEKAILIKWIEQGAEYQPHWAFSKPLKPRVPEALPDWGENEIDRFIAEKLEQNHIEPSAEADREQLIRRAYFDLTGLPPRLADLDHWMSSKNEDYYVEMIDTLLASDAFGERMAAHWLDVARFADSEGYLDDFHHSFWPYRDWVIKAFNQGLPYDQFIEWQVAGDLFLEATREQVLATAFNRNHKQNSEGGIIPEEFRVEYVADRTNTLGSAFLGLTVNCARCHDHKYDPFSQKDYYQLFGFFNSTIERGDGIFSLNAIENGQMVPHKYAMNAGPVLPLLDGEAQKLRQYLEQQIEQEKQVLKTAEIGSKAGFKQWLSSVEGTDLAMAVEKATMTHLTFDDMQNGRASDQARGAGPVTYTGNIEPVPGKYGQGVRSDAYGQLVADGSRTQFERTEPFTVSFWIKVPEAFESAHVLYNGNNRIQGYRGWDVIIENNQIQFRLNHAHPYQSLTVSPPSELTLDHWTHFVWTYDGSSDAEGMQIYQDGVLQEKEVKRNFVYRSTKPYLDPKATVYMPYKGLIIGNRHYDQDFTNGVLDEVRILNRQADQWVARYLFYGNQLLDQFESASTQKPESLSAFYNLFIDQKLEQHREALRSIQAREVALVDSAQEIMVMGDYAKPRPTYILDRGVYDAHGEQVKPNVPESIFGMPEGLPANRLGLAKWLTHPDNPLTARVTVNQYWYLIFGRGIVETVEDFGSQGALPSHPELLDWLSVDFQENGWNLKGLIKQMVTSATYKQSSVVRPDLQQIDPGNYLLARSPRYRRSAEMIRDNILAVSGLLTNTIGGISTFPYQPPGLWKEVMTHSFFPEYQEDQNSLYRRSIYTFWKRNMPPPNMLIFDASSRAECQVRRQRSSTPLQALVLLNDPQIVEGCRVLAERTLLETRGDKKKALTNIFRVLTSRYPNESELSILESQWQQERDYFKRQQQAASAYLDIGYWKTVTEYPSQEVAALARVANTVFNSTESYYKN